MPPICLWIIALESYVDNLFAQASLATLTISHFSQLEWTRQHWRRFQQFFGLLKEISLLGHRHRQLLHRCDAVAAFVDYFMGQYSPEWTNQESQTKSKKSRQPIADFEKKIYPDLVNFMLAWAACFRSLQISANSRPETAFSDCPLLEMTERDKLLFFDREMLVPLIKMGYSVEANLDICAHASFDNIDHSALLLSCSCESLLKATNPQHVGNALAVLDRLLSINDDLLFWRVAVLFQLRDYGIFGVLRMMHEPTPSERRDPSLVDMLIEWLTLTLRNRPVVAGWLVQSRDVWRSYVLDVTSSRLRSLKSSGAPEPRVKEMQQNFALLEQAASHTLPENIDQLWDPTFSLTNYTVHTIPREPARK